MPKLGSLVHPTQEDRLVIISEGKVESLGGEVSDDIGRVAMPEGQDSLLLGDTNHAVCNALVLLMCGDLLAGMLHLQQQLDLLHGHDRCLGDGHATPPARKSLAKDTAASVRMKGKKEQENAGLGCNQLGLRGSRRRSTS